jgi:hypothetical protein
VREEHWRTREPGIWREYQQLLRDLSRYEAVDALRRSFGGARLGIGRMALYRTVSAEQVADPATLSDDEKRNGIDGPRCWVPFRKGDRAGNRWLSDEPLFIRWDRETVRYFYANSGKKGANMPVVRNPHMYFQELVTFDRRIRDSVIKGRLLPACVFDAGTPAVRSSTPSISANVILAVLNSPVSTGICKSFLNNTNFETSDFRTLPIVVPSPDQRERIGELVGQVMEVQRRVLAGEAGRAELEPVEAAINAEVFDLYGIDMSLAPVGWDVNVAAVAEAADDEAGADE